MTEKDQPGIVNPADFEKFQALGEREQNAVWLALKGISQKRVGREVKPMRVVASHDKPFDFPAFASVMDDLGLHIDNAFEKTGDDTYVFIFDPIPFEELQASSLNKNAEPQN